jgi:hypothetical protein
MGRAGDASSFEDVSRGRFCPEFAGSLALVVPYTQIDAVGLSQAVRAEQIVQAHARA